MTQSIIEQNKQVAAEVEAAARKQANTDTQASAEILDKATATVKTVRNIWGMAQQELLDKIGATPENRKMVFDVFADLQRHHINAIYNGVQFIDMYNYHMNGAGD